MHVITMSYSMKFPWAFTPAGFARNDLSADRQAGVVVHFTFEPDRTVGDYDKHSRATGKSDEAK